MCSIQHAIDISLTIMTTHKSGESLSKGLYHGFPFHNTYWAKTVIESLRDWQGISKGLDEAREGLGFFELDGSFIGHEAALEVSQKVLQRWLINDVNWEHAACAAYTWKHIDRALQSNATGRKAYLTTAMFEHLLRVAGHGTSVVILAGHLLDLAHPKKVSRRKLGLVEKTQFRHRRYLVSPWIHNEHWGVVIYEFAERHVWVADSMGTKEDTTVCNRAVAALNAFLAHHSTPIENQKIDTVVSRQITSWSCGIHAAEFVRAFLHEDRLLDWRKSNIYRKQRNEKELELKMLQN